MDTVISTYVTKVYPAMFYKSIFKVPNTGRITDYNKKLPLLEIYPCVQSEGSRQGRPTFLS